LLFICLNIGKHRPTGEQAVIKGSSDLVAHTPNNNCLVVEVKHYKPKNNQSLQNLISENPAHQQKSNNNII
jgi:hypothetical protein